MTEDKYSTPYGNHREYLPHKHYTQFINSLVVFIVAPIAENGCVIDVT